MADVVPQFAGRLHLGPEVDIVRRRGALLLYSRASGQAIRISSAAGPLLPLLQRGAELAELKQALAIANPRANDVHAKLVAFLGTLTKTGILSDEYDAGRPQRIMQRRKFPLFDPNGVTGAVARLLLLLFGTRGAVAVGMILVAAATGAIAALAIRGGLPPLWYLMEHLDVTGILLFVVLVVPVHEFAHALGCRLAGVRAGMAGVVLHGGFLPGPYVDCDESYRVISRRRRLVIPAAGPFVDLLAAGLCAALLNFVGPQAPFLGAVRTVLLLSLLFVFFDTNLFAPSDGSHCLEAVLDDELARRNMFVTKGLSPDDARHAARYRTVAALHFGLGSLLLALWWFGPAVS